MFKKFRNAVLRRGLQTVMNASSDVAANATSKSFHQRFDVRQFPVTIYVRGSYVEVKVKRQLGYVVEVIANLRAAFGWEFATDQDDNGIYVVAKRKIVVGQLSTAKLTIIAPPQAHLVANLTPGTVTLYDLNGKLTIPGEAFATEPVPVIIESNTKSAPQLPSTSTTQPPRRKKAKS